MTTTEKILFARNELEILIEELQKKLQMSNDDMLLVSELIAGSSRYKVIIKNCYDGIKPAEEKGEDK